MVVELAAASPEDVEAILGELGIRARERVEALLSEYRGEVIPLATATPAKAIAQPITIEGLSPWLAARLDRRAQTTAARPGSLSASTATEARELGIDYSMTQTAFEALRTAAAMQEANEERAPAVWSSPARKTLLGRRAAR
jgi:hypothetical protein